tara:strand:+ start:85 stop:432 length:348 start_codon:yes stop_codon:yes gene_type:complete
MQFYKIVNIHFVLLVFLFANMTASIATETKRPSANNKVGHTKKSAEERENSIINRIMKNEAFISEDLASKRKSEQINSNELVINQIKTLSELNRDGFLSDEEFESKKALLLERIQ